jgi:2-amino-4-hydroxy-6-hydroxymethyldihydropteridine diphosphokinase
MEGHSKIVSLSLGSNLGEKETNIKIAIQQLKIQVGKVLKLSSFFQTEPWGFSSQNEFVNCCCLVETNLSAHELIATTQRIETELGRRKLSEYSYEDRVIDIDVIFFENEIINEKSIRIPHQNFRKREFVLNPLLELSNQIDPETFITLNQFTR